MRTMNGRSSGVDSGRAKLRVGFTMSHQWWSTVKEWRKI